MGMCSKQVRHIALGQPEQPLGAQRTSLRFATGLRLFSEAGVLRHG
jgi:hypothetical protein